MLIPGIDSRVKRNLFSPSDGVVRLAARSHNVHRASTSLILHTILTSDEPTARPALSSRRSTMDDAIRDARASRALSRRDLIKGIASAAALATLGRPGWARTADVR